MQRKHLWLAVVIVMTASSAQAQHFLPNPYRGIPWRAAMVAS
jgi:hypothetical protein